MLAQSSLRYLKASESPGLSTKQSVENKSIEPLQMKPSYINATRRSGRTAVSKPHRLLQTDESSKNYSWKSNPIGPDHATKRHDTGGGCERHRDVVSTRIFDRWHATNPATTCTCSHYKHRNDLSYTQIGHSRFCKYLKSLICSVLTQRSL
jgi:hypothetical protein